MRVRDYHTYNPLHNPLWFSLTPTSSYLNPWEVDSPNTYHTHPKCKVRFWCRWEALEEAICLLDAIGLNCVFRRAREDKASSSQLVVGAWKAQVHRVDQAWRIFCFYVLTHSLLNRFTTSRATDKFFATFFDNTSACYLVFTFFFLTLLAFILLFIFDEYGLE